MSERNIIKVIFNEYLNLNINELQSEILNNLNLYIIYNVLNDDGKFMLYNLNHLKLVQFCVMLGCDYIKSIKGLGMRTLIKLFKEVESFEDIVKAVSSYGKYRFEEQNGDSTLYLEQAKEACSVFYYQMIYDDENKKIKHLCEDTLWHYFRRIDTLDDIIEKSWITSIIENNKNMDYYGKNFENYVDFCNGELDVEKLTSEKNMESIDSINKYLIHLLFK